MQSADCLPLKLMGSARIFAMWGQTNSTAQGAVAPLSPLAPPLRKLQHYPVLYKCIIWPDCMCMVEFSVYYRLKFAVDTSYSCS